MKKHGQTLPDSGMIRGYFATKLSKPCPQPLSSGCAVVEGLKLLVREDELLPLSTQIYLFLSLLGKILPHQNEARSSSLLLGEKEINIFLFAAYIVLKANNFFPKVQTFGI